MKTGTLLLVLACYVTMTYSQQCRQVVTTVCDDDATFTWTQKIEKSELKCPGADGPIGAGENDHPTESCILGSLGTDIVTRLAKIEELLESPNNATAPTSTTTTIHTAPTTTSPITFCTTSSNGAYVIDGGFEVFCEDGWTMLQRRIDGVIDFRRGWDDYKRGFGRVYGEYWMGLDNIHQMTQGGGCRLRIELWDFDGNQTYAEYSSFSVDSPGNLYRLRVSGYSGNAGDSLMYHNNRPFSTWDKDNDGSSYDCASLFGKQGWWFGTFSGTSCFLVTLNGIWGQSTAPGRGIIWYTWKGLDESLEATKMKFRCD
ncbi:unnamed protein product [Clavelina lepadiformis]|uniref:Fibrinogen C-terminal domain-containing protein n=1 Tax=Clavelina lepadiformis TaxID=159417 RepID=A0ABP0G4N2_CLALP